MCTHLDTARAVTEAGSVLSLRSYAVCMVSLLRNTSWHAHFIPDHSNRYITTLTRITNKLLLSPIIIIILINTVFLLLLLYYYYLLLLIHSFFVLDNTWHQRIPGCLLLALVCASCLGFTHFRVRDKDKSITVSQAGLTLAGLETVIMAALVFTGGHPFNGANGPQDTWQSNAIVNGNFFNNYRLFTDNNGLTLLVWHPEFEKTTSIYLWIVTYTIQSTLNKKKDSIHDYSIIILPSFEGASNSNNFFFKDTHKDHHFISFIMCKNLWS